MTKCLMEGKFSDWAAYNKFIRDQKVIADQAFSKIGLESKIHTNWISMNGWVVEQKLEKEIINTLQQLTIDHYYDQKTVLPPTQSADNMIRDVERIHQMWQVPILIGEWGYNIEQDVSAFEQKETVREVLKKVSEKEYIIGFNYWAHMGNTSRIIDDQKGGKLLFRPAALELKKFFNEEG